MAQEWTNILTHHLQLENLPSGAAGKGAAALLTAVGAGDVVEQKLTALLLKACQETFQAMKDAPEGERERELERVSTMHQLPRVTHVVYLCVCMYLCICVAWLLLGGKCRREPVENMHSACDRAGKPRRSSSQDNIKRAEVTGFLRGLCLSDTGMDCSCVSLAIVYEANLFWCCKTEPLNAQVVHPHRSLADVLT